MTDDELWEEVRQSGEDSAARLQLLLNTVEDLPSFIRFVDALSNDREDTDRKQSMRPAGTDLGWNGWENGSIGTFLESAVAWVKDNRRADPAFLTDENPWKATARILYAGKYYE
ncbi:hypothetical protein FJ970_22915 [Mesorhizobium sp. B2-1-8]|uniref:DUF7660 family protein n=1 Tax=Mesorhizobium sp. B2-1-8 TaxID=2589967 RepID=UPI00112A3982|nr:hypothetical protein [Mesorhizobium sp. B2-1-8]UCI17934.1 hypothetical protein FJ970_22915 [Mesorhizobium sp. B2-1-8]